MDVRWALALFGDAMDEGESGPVETGLTGQVAMAPYIFNRKPIMDIQTSTTSD